MCKIYLKIPNSKIHLLIHTVLAVNTDARYDMLHRASSPSPAPAPPIPPASSAAIARAIASRHHGNHTCSTPQRQPQPPPTLPEKPCRTITATANQTSTTGQTGSNNGPPVPPPSSAPRPPKSGKEGARQDHHYENTIMICGTSQHVAKNVNLEANKARLTALMRAKDDPGSGGCAATKPESAAYENVNIEHITCLTALGFAQDAVIRALGITRNDLEMARDILHEFATKSSWPGEQDRAQ